jgi:hypothetical protein
MLGTIDKRDVNVFKVLAWRIMNDGHGSAEHGTSRASKRLAAMSKALLF